MMNRALAELRERAETAETIRSDPSVTWQRELAQIGVLKANIVRRRQQLTQGQLRAPISGTVVDRQFFVGEGIRTSDVALHICEDDSQEVILYVPQGKTQTLSVGQVLSITVPPDNAPLSCEVSRFATSVSAPPPSLRRYFDADEAVVAVHCQPLADAPSGQAATCSLRLGYEVRWESSWWPRRPTVVRSPRRGPVNLETDRDFADPHADTRSADPDDATGFDRPCPEAASFGRAGAGRGRPMSVVSRDNASLEASTRRATSQPTDESGLAVIHRTAMLIPVLPNLHPDEANRLDGLLTELGPTSSLLRGGMPTPSHEVASG